MKQHPSTVLLAEPQPQALWRVVARATTRDGYAAGPSYSLVAHNLTKPEAKRLVRYVKDPVANAATYHYD